MLRRTFSGSARRAVLAVFTAAVLGALALPDTADAEGLGYVALGDSFTAGPLISEPYGDPLLCLRSRQNYPNLVAQALGAAEFTDASCSGATTADMASPQRLAPAIASPAQLDALSEDTDLVTVGIGGNDAGFTEVMTTCASLSASDPVGDPCQRHYGDDLAERIPDVAEKVGEVLSGISERSPAAEVAVVGYLQILPERHGCWPAFPVARGDVAYLDGIQTGLNAALEGEAAAAGVTFVDVFERGHDVCQRGGDRWVEGVVTTNPAAPVHPNASGMAEVADRVADAVATPTPA